MRWVLIIATSIWLVGCAGQGATKHESHRSAVDNLKIDYPYWDDYLLQHGEAETLLHFDSVLEETTESDRDTLIASFERFCRFQRCLAGYREKQGREPN
jgi:uncharacterized lipoprotein YehR (DUF1307 family)